MPLQGVQKQRETLLNQRLFGMTIRAWLGVAALLMFCVLVYEGRRPQTPNAFDQPGAQSPNRLRSSWGVENPI
jgi:hypothetical protein